MTDRAVDARRKFTQAELADELGVSIRLIKQLTKDGQLPHYRLGNRVFYLDDVVHDHLRKQALASLRPAIPTAPGLPPVRRRRRVVQPASSSGGSDARSRRPARPEGDAA
jgi:excisionase family DNA binding protein